MGEPRGRWAGDNRTSASDIGRTRLTRLGFDSEIREQHVLDCIDLRTD